jgi:hypothetical protein
MKDYIGWAIGKGYAVIDVNIPKHVTVEPVSMANISSLDATLTRLVSPESMKRRRKTDPQPQKNLLDTCGTTILSKWTRLAVELQPSG